MGIDMEMQEIEIENTICKILVILTTNISNAATNDFKKNDAWKTRIITVNPIARLAEIWISIETGITTAIGIASEVTIDRTLKTREGGETIITANVGAIVFQRKTRFLHLLTRHLRTTCSIH
mmetsp:Transcript_10832/g.15798  ORF Transcript_10832/g.15798 Transcript_10832/m.15798 type:complete len:122 (+) Transcript_10832:79-444(+)